MANFNIRNKPMGDDWAGKGKAAANNKAPGIDDGGLGNTEAPERDQFIPVKKPKNLMDFLGDDEMRPNKSGGGFVH